MREKYYFKMETLVWKEGICPPSLRCHVQNARAARAIAAATAARNAGSGAAAVAAKSIHELVGRSVGRSMGESRGRARGRSVQFDRHFLPNPK